MSADLRAYLQPLAPLMEAARRALKETPFRLGDDPDDLLAAVVIAISTELSGPSLAVMDKLKQAEAERDRLRAADGRVRALHKPQSAKRVKPCGTHGPATVCSGCEVQEVTVCSHVGCHGWPCDTLAALDQDGGTDADT